MGSTFSNSPLEVEPSSATLRSMPLQNYTAILSERKVLNPKFQHLKFELKTPNTIEFLAGQYVSLLVPTHPQRKSFSISSTPSVNHAIEMLVDIAPQGPATKYLSTITPGTEVSFMAPIGQFVIAPPETSVGAEEKSLVFVATGSGVAPMMGMLQDLLIHKNDTRPMILYWGLRFAQDQCWYDEFQQLAQQHPNFVFHPTLSQAPEEWKLCRGRVTDCLAVHPLPAEQAGYYLCGNSGMIEEVKQFLLGKGVAAPHIHTEKFH